MCICTDFPLRLLQLYKYIKILPVVVQRGFQKYRRIWQFPLNLKVVGETS